jgi:hypothetical protein
MSKTVKTQHTWGPGIEYLTNKKGEISAKELKVLRQYITQVMEPEGLNDFKYYFGTLRHPELSQDLHDKHDQLYNLALLCIKGIRYEEQNTQGITFFAHIEYNQGGEEALKPHLNERNAIPTVLHLLRINIATRLRYELAKNREADKRHEQKYNKVRLSNTFVTSVAPKPITSVLSLGDQELPEGVTVEPLQYKNRLGGDIQLTGYQHDLFIALLELNHKKSQTTNSKQDGFYLGDYYEQSAEQHEIIKAENNKIQRLPSPHFKTSYNEIATQINGGTKPSKDDKKKVIDTMWDLVEKAELWPQITFTVGKDKYKLNKSLFEIIEHENGAQKDIIVRLNPVVTHNIHKHYYELPANFTAQKIEIGKQLGKQRPDFLMVLIFYIMQQRANELNQDEQGRPYWETGLLKTKNGQPGIYYKCGYSRYEEQRNQKRFIERWNTAIEFLKGLKLIEEYSEGVTNWGDKKARFTFNAKPKKVG